MAHKYQEHHAKYKCSNPKSYGLKRVKKKRKACKIIRYADDFIIFCEDKEYAKVLLNQVRKYLKYKLKLDLSEEKTYITDMREKRVKFLGFEFFNVSTPTKRYKYTTKSIPDTKRLDKKVREIILEIRKLNNLKTDRDNAVQIEKINSKIVGIAEFYKTSTSVKIMNARDNRIFQACYKKWVKMKIPGKKLTFRKYTVCAKETTNRQSRHADRTDKVFYLECDTGKFGITKLKYTHAIYPKRNKINISKYTYEGRQYLKKKTSYIETISRFGIYNYQTLERRKTSLEKNINPIYNFEYMMNREYVVIIDKLKCRCCKKELHASQLNCHHINPYLPIQEINKTKNLATVCKDCHFLIHSKKELDKSNIYGKKIEQFRIKLNPYY